MLLQGFLEVGGSRVGNKVCAHGNTHNKRGKRKSSYSEISATLLMEGYWILSRIRKSLEGHKSTSTYCFKQKIEYAVDEAHVSRHESKDRFLEDHNERS